MKYFIDLNSLLAVKAPTNRQTRSFCRIGAIEKSQRKQK